MDYQGLKGRAAFEKKKLHLKEEALAVDRTPLAELRTGTLCGLGHFSCGSIQPTRQAILRSDEANQAVVANGKEVYHVKVGIPNNGQVVKKGTKAMNMSMSMKLDGVGYTTLLFDKKHKSEIQSLAALTSDNESITVASSDARGHVRISRVLATKSSDGPPEKRRLAENSALSSLVGEHSWSGVAFGTRNAALRVTTVHSSSHVVRSFDASSDCSTPIRSVRSVLPPSSLCYTKEGTLLITEATQVSLWDERLKSGNGFVARAMPSSSSFLYAAAASGDGNTIAVGGQNKIVYMYDTRRWKIRNSWPCPLKRDVIGLSFSPTNESLCYVIGLNHEVMCGKPSLHEELKKLGKDHGALHLSHRLGFHGDSRWVGVGVVEKHGVDALLGVSEGGRVYSVMNAQNMYPI